MIGRMSFVVDTWGNTKDALLAGGSFVVWQAAEETHGAWSGMKTFQSMLE